jgi:hypothetical protein
MICALQQVRAEDLKIGEETYRIRTDLAGHALAALQAAGVKPPPRGAPIRAL